MTTIQIRRSAAGLRKVLICDGVCRVIEAGVGLDAAYQIARRWARILDCNIKEVDE
jgi:hypothetical protein